ncbi:MAG: hypothetical protein IPH20_22025 [Bacteroidales bacterium]|nr:hypothetical protein [Bacteroidales bacterium]
MKNFLTNSVFYLLLGLLIATLNPLIAESQIVSAPGGGIWSSGTTWVGGIVPGAADNVEIVSIVHVNGNACNNIIIATGGVLQNYIANNYTLTINGNLTNHGTISNNTGYSLSLNVNGNVGNYGIMSNYTLTLTGSANQQIASTQLISIANFTKNNTSGRAIATTSLSFVGTNINLNSDTLGFTTGNSLSISGGSLSSGVLYKPALPALVLTTDNGTYLNAMNINVARVDLYGTIQIYSTNSFIGQIVNNGTLQNSLQNSYTLTITGNFINNGTVQNNGYNLYLNISGNITNNGSWTNYITTLNGAGNQELSMTQPFGCSNLTRNAATGRVKALSDLNFTGTNITLNDTLEFTTGSSIALNGGYIGFGVLNKAALPVLKITTENGAYLYAMNVNAPLIELYGTLLIYSTNHFKGEIVNYGTLQNSPQNSYTLTITGSFTNNGTVQNNGYYLYLNISGNITNNGIWTNYITTLNGAGNQELSMTQPFECSNLTRNAAAGRIKAITDLSFIGTSIILNDTLEFTTGNSIAISGGYIGFGVLNKSALPVLKITTENGAYLYAMSVNAPQIELYGMLLIYGANTFKGHTINYGTLQNSPQNSYTMTITGNFTNNGTVQNNAYFLNLNISGNLANNGIWTNYLTTLNGNGNQELSMSLPFGCSNLTRNAAAGRIIAISDLSFMGTNITLNDTLEFSTGNSIAISGGYLSSGVLYKPALPALKVTTGSGAYLYIMNIDAPQIELYGSLLIYGTNNYKGHVINYGTLQNMSYNNFGINVAGNFTNNGTVKNNGYYLYLTISGNITNNGTWRNYQTTLNGTGTHYLAFSDRYEGDFFTNGNAAGSMIATTDLVFDGTTIELNNCSFSLGNGSLLSVLNGSLSNTVIAGSDIQFHSLGAYCVGVVFNADVTLKGVVQVGSGVGFNGSIINDGVLRNRSVNHYEIQVQGGIHNNGSIVNNNYNLTLTVLGDIHNNGIWSNYSTILDGTSDQNIFLINGSSIQGQIRLDANFTGSSFAWWGPQGNLVGNIAFSGANTQNLYFNNPVTDDYAGQYYCANNTGIHSRNIFIQSQLNPVRFLTLNLLLEGLYDSNGMMHPSLDASGLPVWSLDVADQITVELHDNGNFSDIVFTKAEVLLSTDGTVTFAVPAAYSSNYYIAIRHRSGIVTVSASAVPFNTPQVNYNFDLATKAYGNNMALMPDGWYALYGGDVNQDGIVDTADMTPVDNGSAAYLSGYRNPDANGDGIIDTADMTLVDNNSANYVSASYP